MKKSKQVLSESMRSLFEAEQYRIKEKTRYGKLKPVNPKFTKLQERITRNRQAFSKKFARTSRSRGAGTDCSSSSVCPQHPKFRRAAIA